MMCANRALQSTTALVMNIFHIRALRVHPRSMCQHNAQMQVGLEHAQTALQTQFPPLINHHCASARLGIERPQMGLFASRVYQAKHR
jgi:hypothetical protein